MKHDPDRDVKLLMDYSAEIGKTPVTFGSPEVCELCRRRKFAEKYEAEDMVGETYKGE